MKLMRFFILHGLVFFISVFAQGQSFPFSPIGDGAIHRFTYQAPHAKRKGLVELNGNIFQTSDVYKVVLTWQKCDLGETPLDDEPIQFSFNRDTLFWNQVAIKINPSNSTNSDLTKAESGLIESGNKFIINGKNWGPWRKYLIVDEDALFVISISRDYGIVEWIEYSNEKDYKNNDCVRKFTVSGTSKKKMDVGSLKMR